MQILHEQRHIQEGKNLIAGVDEVGRGALAGPLVVAAVILDLSAVPYMNVLINNDVISGLGAKTENNENEANQEIEQMYLHIKDSKKTSPKKRVKLAEFIRNNALAYNIALIENEKVDEWGITKATQVAFFEAVNGLKKKPQHILTDAFKINAINDSKQTAIINGDNKSISIAAASIVAKVYRDNLMVQYHKTFPKYFFDKHKGYGTKLHREAIMRHGPCVLHRRSFKLTD